MKYISINWWKEFVDVLKLNEVLKLLGFESFVDNWTLSVDVEDVYTRMRLLDSEEYQIKYDVEPPKWLITILKKINVNLWKMFGLKVYRTNN